MYMVQKSCVGADVRVAARLEPGAVSLWACLRERKAMRREKGGTIRSLKTMDLENGVLAGF